MEIILTKGKSRNTLTCQRADGTSTGVNLGPNIPNHDIAHYIVEKAFQLQNGFFGKIKSGMTIAELSDKEIIKTLGPESWLAEILARNLQSIGSGAASVEQFIDLINWEANSIGGIEVPSMSLLDIEKMKANFDQLCEAWDLTPEHGVLKLTF